MRILVKFPTRERPKQFLKVLKLLNEKAADRNNINYLITIDSDDGTMTQEVQDEAMNINNVEIYSGKSNSKIHACNRDMEKNRGWDIVVLMSDDMVVQVDGWDEVIRQDMAQYVVNMDGVLWYPDGYQNRICTLSIMSKKYYDRFNYLYHPDYLSLFCDDEFTKVALGLHKMFVSGQVLFKHEHYANNPQIKKDKLYNRNEALYHVDKKTYDRRKARGFQD